jgi:hypothetical protein
MRCQVNVDCNSVVPGVHFIRFLVTIVILRKLHGLATRPPHSAHTSTQDVLNIYTQLFNFLTLILIINIPHEVSIVENIFINNYTLDECTCHFITYQ